ncbi:hypothetical protein IMCC20628_04695 (plasmid) [Hoeflea sp. IMCC20628]|uniref:hypothetical protein n=1 Tax=Hoeflea sp. IMCC20628 TaxID=1620421 RepID=UPI00063AC0C4|nr:hypothetical protein [Hoeflea sp. IMCC20628]AKI03361.1 hypothetical protein IMCC20628_04695 [Hoeflea sp. IMCC20628]
MERHPSVTIASDLDEPPPKRTDGEHDDASAETSDAGDASKYFRFVAVDREERLRVICDEKYTDGDPSELTFVHIGKCGGYTVADALAISHVVKERFSRIKRIHIRPPHYQKKARYLIVLRNPIDRLSSAFAWRYEKVVKSKDQEFRFAGEFEVLEKYNDLNTMAERLIRDGEFCIEAIGDMLKIVHFSQDIFYYLDPLMRSVRPDQIFSVFTQETLQQDMQEMLGVDDAVHMNRNESDLAETNMRLSPQARRNLKRFFARDYECIRTLDALYPLGQDRLKRLLL